MAMLFVTGFGAIPLLFAAHVEMPWRTLIVALPLFLFAFLFFGSLMLGTGSLGSNMREAQQLSMMWSLTAALPMMLMSVLVREPHGLVARVMTWLPLTAGPVIVMRSSMDADSLAWWEIAGPMLLLVGATWLAIRIGARLFRVGLLSAGARPSLREVIRQARLRKRRGAQGSGFMGFRGSRLGSDPSGFGSSLLRTEASRSNPMLQAPPLRARRAKARRGWRTRRRRCRIAEATIGGDAGTTLGFRASAQSIENRSHSIAEGGVMSYRAARLIVASGLALWPRLEWRRRPSSLRCFPASRTSSERSSTRRSSVPGAPRRRRTRAWRG